MIPRDPHNPGNFQPSAGGEDFGRTRYVTQFADESFYARITARGTGANKANYSWTAIGQFADGTYEDRPAPASGTFDAADPGNWPAREVSLRLDVPCGAIVRLYRSYGGNYLTFIYDSPKFWATITAREEKECWEYTFTSGHWEGLVADECPTLVDDADPITGIANEVNNHRVDVGSVVEMTRVLIDDGCKYVFDHSTMLGPDSGSDSGDDCFTEFDIVTADVVCTAGRQWKTVTTLTVGYNEDGCFDLLNEVVGEPIDISCWCTNWWYDIAYDIVCEDTELNKYELRTRMGYANGCVQVLEAPSRTFVARVGRCCPEINEPPTYSWFVRCEVDQLVQYTVIYTWSFDKTGCRFLLNVEIGFRQVIVCGVDCCVDSDSDSDSGDSGSGSDSGCEEIECGTSQWRSNGFNWELVSSDCDEGMTPVAPDMDPALYNDGFSYPGSCACCGIVGWFMPVANGTDADWIMFGEACVNGGTPRRPSFVPKHIMRQIFACICCVEDSGSASEGSDSGGDGCFGCGDEYPDTFRVIDASGFSGNCTTVPTGGCSGANGTRNLPFAAGEGTCVWRSTLFIACGIAPAAWWELNGTTDPITLTLFPGEGEVVYTRSQADWLADGCMADHVMALASNTSGCGVPGTVTVGPA